MSARDVYHEGEIAVQERAGARAEAARNGAMIARTIMPGARPFLAAQRMLVLAGEDAGGAVWAALRFGQPGFVRCDAEGAVVHLERDANGTSPAGPLERALAPGRKVGLLAIDLATRRRLRVNGIVSASVEGALEIAVREAFPNCPKYIQRRRPIAAGDEHAGADERAEGEALDAERQDLVARVDTAFVASVHAERGFDASHRGGEPGFVRVLGERALRFPDYPGNGMFQTLGNLVVDPRAGVTLVDFERGRLLSLTGTASVSFGEEDATHPTGGTGRTWDFTIEHWVESALPSTTRWELSDRSPFNPPPHRP